jgi:hypothetical protein
MSCRIVVLIPGMDDKMWAGLGIVQEILAAMNKAGKSQGEIFNMS